LCAKTPCRLYHFSLGRVDMEMKYTDTHAHLNFAAYDADRAEVITRALEQRVGVINVGTQKDTSNGAVELAEQNEHMWATVGLHPIHTSASYHDAEELGEGGKEFTSRGEVFDYDFYKKLAAHPKVVAIGECGLDFFRQPEGAAQKKQEEVFVRQIELANEVGKSLMLHIRSAYAEAYEIIKRHARVHGNLHFFAGSVEEAQLFLDAGFYFSFTGVITFARSYDEVIRFLPLGRIMSETDCPFVSPAPHRGKRNEPAFVVEVARKIADIRDEDRERVRAALVENAKSCYALPHV